MLGDEEGVRRILVRRQRRRHLLGIGEALGGVDGEGALHDGGELGVDVHASSERLVITRERAPGDLRDGAEPGRWLAGDAVVDDRSDTVEVRAVVHVAARELLRRHERRRAQDLPGRGQAGVTPRVHQLGDAEVDDLGDLPTVVATLDDDVAGLHVPVDDADPVGCAERGEELPRETDHSTGGQLALVDQQL